jgi:CRISPR type I-E-associated protein CasB/Cse2
MNAPKWDIELVNKLIELARPDDPERAVLAHLRRGLDRPLDYTLGRVGWLFRRVPSDALNSAVLATGLFAWVKGNCPQADGVNFGTAFGAELTLDEKKQREKRFIDLLDTDAEELGYKLRQAITLIARDGAELDWRLLIRDLGCWNRPSRRVQKDWARGFWSAPEAATSTEDQQPVSE